MSHTILIADDDTELCELLREYLGLEGFEVRLAHDGEQADRNHSRHRLPVSQSG